jgi:hypothetical protein
MAGEDDSVGISVSADASGGVDAFDSLAASIDQFGGSASSAAGGMATLSQATEASVIPQRAAHQALNLVGADIIAMTGAGAAATGPMHLLSSTLFAVAMGGGEISLAFVGITAAIAAASYVVKEFAGGSHDATTALAASLKGYKDDTEAINAYTAAGGRLSEALKAVAASTTEAAQKTIAELSATNSAKLATDLETEAIAKNTLAYVQRSSARNNDTTGLAATTAALKSATSAVDDDRAAVEANAHGYATWQEYIKGTTKSLTDNADAGKQGQAVYDSLNAEAVKYLATQEKLEGQQTKASLAFENEMSSMRASQVSYQVALDKRYQDQDTKERASFGLMKTNADQAKSIISSSFQSAANSVGQSFAKIAVEGGNAMQAIKALGIQVTEDLIAKFVSMGVEWAAIQVYRTVTHASAEAGIKATEVAALTGSVVANHVAAGAVASSWAFAADTAAAAWGAMLGGPPASAAAVAAEAAIVMPLAAGAHVAAATGADFIADRPTRLLVGEGGQGERVQVTPLSQGGGGSSSSTGANGDTYYFTFGDIVAQGVSDPRAFANKIALLISQAIRGRGQINATGKSIF